jgi:hypothetical protein
LKLKITADKTENRSSVIEPIQSSNTHGGVGSQQRSRYFPTEKLAHNLLAGDGEFLEGDDSMSSLRGVIYENNSAASRLNKT